MSGGRRALHLGNGGAMDVLEERPLLSEEQLHQALATHPTVLPHQDFGLGPLVALGSEIQTESGPLDLLLADPYGRLAICEFKRGTENPDARRVVAQLLDYGASLWRHSFEDLERLCQRARPGFEDGLTDLVERSLLAQLSPDAETDAGAAPYFDREAFESGVRSTLETGSFVFLYVVRDLDARTQRIMTYLAESARMSFFGVEVDHFQASDGSSTLVPRVSFVPSWVAAPQATSADPDAARLIELMDEVAARLGVRVEEAPTGRRYRGPGKSYIGVYRTSRGMEIGLKGLREAGESDLADLLLQRLEEWLGRPLKGTCEYPAFRSRRILDSWPVICSKIVEPFLTGSSNKDQ